MPKPLPYPETRVDETVDLLHGVRVPDPYRWLETDDSDETRAWIDAQNALTRAYLDSPERSALVERLTWLFDYPRTGVPVSRGGRYFFTHNPGLEKQPILYVQDGLEAPRRALLDPNTLSPDGTTALTAFSPSDDGRLLAYALSSHGSDRQEIFVREVASGQDHGDHLRWAKFTSIAWLPDASGFYYTRYPEPRSVPRGDEHYYGRVYLHRLGVEQSQDLLIYERPDDREIVPAAAVSDDGRWVVVTAFKGSSDRSEVYVGEAGGAGALRPLFTGFTAAYSFLDGDGDRLFFVTDENAPRRKIVAVDPSPAGLPAASDVVPESGDKLNLASMAKDTLVLSYLHRASDRIRLFSLDGAPQAEVALPGLGSLAGLAARPRDPEFFFAFTSFTSPPAIYRGVLPSAAPVPFAAARGPVDPSQYETKQVLFSSRDGTRVSMFLVHRKGLTLDGERPVRLYGYGGFNISMTPGFDPANALWLERGGVFALVNLRGGGEYGEDWHRAGMFERKQNVFDDFIAAAEWLIAGGYTNPRRLAIEGGSNGGLLVAAAMTQRPELFGAVVCRVPVADMLRYHLFTVGRFWISEYGSADDPDQFRYLLKYSPYHSVRDGVRYPATLIMTADTDDRVAPAMARKLAARLQGSTAGPDPIFIRVEMRAGHGAGKPVMKMIEEDADIFAFLFKVLAV
jgi:prolyl oligopeptidase